MGEATITETKTPTARDMLDVIISECKTERDKAIIDLDGDYAYNLLKLLNELGKIKF